MSLLDTIGSDIKKVFNWFGSTKGKAITAAIEGGVEDVFPQATGVINIINSWAMEAFKTQAIATAAGAQSGSNEQKAAMTISAVGPEVLSFAKANGLPAPTTDKLKTINDAVVTILNAFDTGATSSASSAPAATPAQGAK